MEHNFPIVDKMLTVTLFLFAASSMFSISISQVSAGIGGFLWLARTHLTNTWGKQRWPLGIPFLLFCSASALAVANAYDISYSFPPLKKLLEILIFFWILNCVRENNLRNSLSLTLIVSATFASLFGLYQAWQAAPWLGVLRVEGTLSIYMTFAGLLMMVGVLAMARIMFCQSTQKWIWASTGIIFYCLLLTLTRQAWLGLIVGILFLVFFWRKKFLLFLPLLIIIIFLLSPDAAKTRVFETIRNMVSSEEEMIARPAIQDWTLLMRINLWQFGWKVFKDYPLTGCGFRCMDLVNDQYIDPFSQEQGSVRHLRGMHNNFIQIAVDTGILGLATWLGIWAGCFWLLYRKATNLESDSSERWVVFGSAATALAFLTGGFFETNFYDSEVAMLLYFIMALPFSGTTIPPKAVVKTSVF